MSAETAKNRWALTQAALHGLLERLDADPERAGEKYEQLRRRLVWFFEMRGSVEAEQDVDETLNRITRRIEDGEIVENLPAYAHGVARMVLFEALRRQEREREGEATFVALHSAVDSSGDPRWPCLDACMSALPDDERELILEYYRDEGGSRAGVRRNLAQRIGVPTSMLRARTFRIRERLEACVRRCLGRPRPDRAPSGAAPTRSLVEGSADER
jgi:DNA-directed RNA polymerase specialized sigma24 family protein